MVSQMIVNFMSTGHCPCPHRPGPNLRGGSASSQSIVRQLILRPGFCHHHPLKVVKMLKSYHHHHHHPLSKIFVIFPVNHNHIREAVVEVESFPKPDFPDLMNNMEMSDMADFDLDFEPNKV